MHISSGSETIVALSTGAALGAIAVIRLSGVEALTIAGKLTNGKRDFAKVKSHTLHFASVFDASGLILDEVVFSIYKNPRSYTGEDVVEISCHGSRYIVQRLLEMCIHYGARTAEPGEFSMRAYLNGKLDLSQAEAVSDLISANSEAAHHIAMNQMRGGFSSEINQLREELIGFTSLIELELDFGEEDVEFADRTDLRKLLLKILSYIKKLQDSFQLGNVIKNGVSTVIAGRPNAGKSTLLNAFLNYERAIVSDIAGTTRDTIEEMININGVEFRLIDTAGIREASDAIEKIGVQKTMDELNKSMLVLYVFDGTEMTMDDLKSDLSRLNLSPDKLIVVANKSDQNQRNDSDFFLDGLVDSTNFIAVSAVQKENLDQLKGMMSEKVMSGNSVEGVIVSNTRHFEALSRSYTYLEKALEGLDTGITGDFIAMDIRHALYALADITGRIDVDKDILGTIFGKFCIGK